MVTNDIVLRGGLILTVTILSGMLGGYLSNFTERGEERSFEKMSNNLTSTFTEISLMGDGSRIIISFGEPPEGIHPFVQFRDSIGDRNPNLRILPGSIFLECDGRRDLILEDDSIIPTFSPLNMMSFSLNILRNVSRSSGGYSIRMPTVIEIEIEPVGGKKVLFIHPVEEIDPRNHSINDIQYFWDRNYLSPEGPDDSLEINIQDGLCVYSSGFILGQELEEDLEWGRCSSVFILPQNTEFQSGPDIEDHSFEFRIVCYNRTFANGLKTRSWKITFY